MADIATTALQLDAMHKEWLAVQRRYHAQLITDDSSTSNNEQQEPQSEVPRRKRARCFISLSDPDLSEQFKGETELQFELPEEYPAAEPVFDLSHFQSRLSSEQFSTIDAAMKTRARELRGTLSLRKLLTFLDNNFYPLLLAATPAPATEEGTCEPPTHDADTSSPSTDARQELDSSVSDAAEPTSDELTGMTIEQSAAPATTTKTKAKKKRKEKDTSKTPCRFFLRQSCKNGDKCAFSHDITPRAAAPREATPATATAAAPARDKASSIEPTKSEQAVKPAKAKKEKKSKSSAPAQETKTSAPAKPTKAARVKPPRACKFFALNKCRDGDACKFLHEAKPAAPGAGESTLDSDKSTSSKRIAIAVLPATSSAEASAVSTTSSITARKDQVASTTAPTSSVNSSSSESWSEAQQKALDAALVKYPASLDKKMRWQRIASDVDGKSLNDCIDRYQLLCKIVRQTAQPSSSSAAATSVSTPTVSAPAPAPAAPVSVSATSTRAQSPPPRPTVTAAEPDDEQQPEDSSVNVDARIIPHSARTAIETEPAQSGAQIRLADLFLHAIGTLVPHRLVCQVQCTNCPLKLDAMLALDAPSVRKWCPRCSVLHLVTMRPVFAHASSDVVAYVDTNEHCRVVDVVPSDLLATCLECNTEVLFPRVTPTRRAEHACFACHTKLALLTRRYVVGEFASSTSSKHKQSSNGQSSPSAKSKGTTKRVVENFVVGQPLPNRGVCEHYRHSYRWFRFQCCGKAFPCDVCHDASDCAEANMGKIASRMICGLCSKEQSSQVKTCACGNEVGRKKVVTSHWEGGTGCRDPTRMAQTDKKKFRGLNKTESKKHNRVGAAAKLSRNGGRGGGSGSD